MLLLKKILFTGSLLCCLMFSSMAQDSLEVEEVRFIGIELQLDYGKLATYFTNFESKLEGGVSLRFKRKLGLVGEFGYGQVTGDQTYSNSPDYQVSGTYLRAGLDWAIYINPESRLMLGANWGMSRFQDEGTFLILSDFWGNYNLRVDRSDLQANWFEIVLKTESMVWNRIWLGIQIRFRGLLNYDVQEPVDVWAIPGYGRTLDETIPALNLSIRYQLF